MNLIINVLKGGNCYKKRNSINWAGAAGATGLGLFLYSKKLKKEYKQEKSADFYADEVVGEIMEWIDRNPPVEEPTFGKNLSLTLFVTRLVSNIDLKESLNNVRKEKDRKMLMRNIGDIVKEEFEDDDLTEIFYSWYE